jgi:hypothetical protein
VIRPASIESLVVAGSAALATKPHAITRRGSMPSLLPGDLNEKGSAFLKLIRKKFAESRSFYRSCAN